MSERALELLDLPKHGAPKLLLDIGCGSGLIAESESDEELKGLSYEEYRSSSKQSRKYSDSELEEEDHKRRRRRKSSRKKRRYTDSEGSESDDSDSDDRGRKRKRSSKRSRKRTKKCSEPVSEGSEENELGSDSAVVKNKEAIDDVDEANMDEVNAEALKLKEIYGVALRPGEGAAIVQYVQQGKHIP
ncbi:putative methyltransferase [Trifolium pratense]|uniref:Putative methyltransferase n=1 Tax=Trifolium pratense TaxID=57577 RepID=A0A2K3NND1_TRIPR|nr:putative methyltransferase [Trifolium pratense]